MREKKLPLEYHTLVTSECWTSFKFSILETSDVLIPWLASHMRIFTNSQGDTYFGENCEIYPFSYYNDILETVDGNILSVEPSKLLDYLKEQIDKEYYVLLDLNYNRIRYPDWDRCWWVWVHEVLVYGYTGDDLLIAVTMGNGVRDIKIPTDMLLTAYTDLIRFYQENPEQLLERHDWLLGITMLKPRNDYRNENAHFDFIRKLQAEIDGAVYKKQLGQSNDEEVFYTGLSCIEALINNIKSIDVKDEQFDEKFKRYLLACITIYDHHNLICNSLHWFIETTDGEADDANNIQDKYTDICKRLYTIIMMFYKYMQKNDPTILVDIPLRLRSVYDLTRNLLNDCIAHCRKRYSFHLQNTVCETNVLVPSDSADDETANGEN